MVQLRRGDIAVSEIKDSSGKVILAQLESIETLDDMDLSNAVLDGIEADGLICMGTRFDNASFRGADLYWIVAIQASFSGANLEDCVFRGGTLTHATLDGALLRRTKFTKDNLGGKTDLSGADLSRAILQEVDFTGAVYDDETKFPAGFDPMASGLVRS